MTKAVRGSENVPGVAYLMNSRILMKRALLFTMIFSAACATGGNDANGRLEDREVAMVMRVANLGEVREGNLARSRATSTAVRDFAAMMVNEHSNAETKAETELSKADLAFVDSNLSRQLDAESGRAAESFTNLNGSDFDRAYIDRQIKVHQSLLDTLDRTLIPQARKRQLRELLAAMRTTVQQHLDRARQLRTTL